MKDNPPFELFISKSKFIGQCFDISHKNDIELILYDLKKMFDSVKESIKRSVA